MIANHSDQRRRGEIERIELVQQHADVVVGIAHRRGVAPAVDPRQRFVARAVEWDVKARRSVWKVPRDIRRVDGHMPVRRERDLVEVAMEKRHSLFEFSLCVSQACLGKNDHFSY